MVGYYYALPYDVGADYKHFILKIKVLFKTFMSSETVYVEYKTEHNCFYNNFC